MANWRLDMRIPVVFGGTPEAGDAVLIEGDAPAPAGFHAIRLRLPAGQAHPIGCACCAPRGPAAEALSRAFLDRATGKAPFFTRVLVLAGADGAGAVAAAVAQDAVVSARYRQAA
ncbi:MAG TPA: hypothetical protein VFN77_02615 [Acetobacteraceae bacterium]|nr:hypothetical protein [Acetobacteraceae bacterium]